MSRDDILKLLEEILPQNIVEHVKAVEVFALKIAQKIRNVDKDLVSKGALLHDIGRSKTHHISHAIIGAEMLSDLGFEKELIHIVENHIGAGVSANEAKKLGLPEKDYFPETIEAKIVAHADNLISGVERKKVKMLVSHLQLKGSIEAADRVQMLHNELSNLVGIDLDEFYD